MGHLKSIVGKHLKAADERLRGIDWDMVKRTPQCIRSKAKLGTNTVDEDFENLHTRFNNTEALLHQLLEACEGLNSSTSQLFESCLSVSKLAAVLLEPDFEHFEEQFQAWQNSQTYQDVMEVISKNINAEYDFIASVVLSRTTEALEIWERVKKQIKNRKLALLDYDQLYNSYETLLIIQTTRQLTEKEIPQLHSMERKLAVRLEKYQSINYTLKEEIPLLLDYTCQMFQVMEPIIFCAQWMAAFKMTSDDLAEIYPGEIFQPDEDHVDFAFLDIIG